MGREEALNPRDDLVTGILEDVMPASSKRWTSAPGNRRVHSSRKWRSKTKSFRPQAIIIGTSENGANDWPCGHDIVAPVDRA